MLEHGKPDGGDACGMGHALIAHQLVQRGCIIGGRKDELHTSGGTRKGQAPAGGMEHRHNGQQHRCAGQIKNAGRNFRHGVQHGGAMLIENTLGIARRAAGVAKHARITLIAHHPVKGAVHIAHQRAIAVVAVKHDEVLHRLQMRFQPVDNRLELGIIHQHPVFGVVHDVDQVFIKQTDIDGVDHAATANGAIPSRQMAVMVHGKGGDPIPRL